MKCIIHNDKDAVGQCNTCGGGLCKDCIHNFTTPICPHCNLKGWTEYKKQINLQKIIVPIVGLVFGIILFLLTHTSISEMLRPYPTLRQSNIVAVIILSLYWCFGVFSYYGWVWINELHKDTVTISQEEGLIGIVLRKLFKLTFALLSGIFIGPYKLYMIYQNNREADKMIKLSSEIIAKNKHHHS